MDVLGRGTGRGLRGGSGTGQRGLRTPRLLALPLPSAGLTEPGNWNPSRGNKQTLVGLAASTSSRPGTQMTHQLKGDYTGQGPLLGSTRREPSSLR